MPSCCYRPTHLLHLQVPQEDPLATVGNHFARTCSRIPSSCVRSPSRRLGVPSSNPDPIPRRVRDLSYPTSPRSTRHSFQAHPGATTFRRPPPESADAFLRREQHRYNPDLPDCRHGCPRHGPRRPAAFIIRYRPVICQTSVPRPHQAFGRIPEPQRPEGPNDTIQQPLARHNLRLRNPVTRGIEPATSFILRIHPAATLPLEKPLPHASHRAPPVPPKWLTTHSSSSTTPTAPPGKPGASRSNNDRPPAPPKAA
jgi:hypothetical protein